MADNSGAVLRIVPPDDPPPARFTDAAAGESPDIVFIVDRDGTILYVNRGLPNVAQEDALGTSIYDYIRLEHHGTVRAVNERVFATGAPGGYEILGMTAATSTAWYDCRVVPTTRSGRVVSATVIARDVTVRKRVEDTLRQELDRTKRRLADAEALAEASAAQRAKIGSDVQREGRPALFRQVLDEAGEAIFIVAPDDGRIIDANETACRWLCRRHEDLIGHKEPDLRLQFPLRVPESSRDHVTETRDTRRPQLFHGEHRRTDGSGFPVEVAITRHEIRGTELVLAVARDSKTRLQVEMALRESEDLYRALFDLSRDAIYLSNRDGTVADINDAGVAMFGYERRELAEFAARDLYLDAGDIRAFQQEVARNGFVRDMPVRFLRRGGEAFDGLLTATLRHAGSGGVLGYQCVIRESVRPGGTIPTTRERLEEVEKQGKGVVLIVEPDAGHREEARKVLELAGIRVLIAESLREATVIFTSRGEEIGAVLLAVSPGEITRDRAFTEIRRLAPASRIVVLSPAEAAEQTIVEHLAAAGLAGIVRKPFHPLALIQQVRGALRARRPGSRATPGPAQSVEAPTDLPDESGTP